MALIDQLTIAPEGSTRYIVICAERSFVAPLPLLPALAAHRLPPRRRNYMTSRFQATAMLLIGVLLLASTPATVRATDSPTHRSALGARFDRTPIGTAGATSISEGNLIINGRRATGDQLIWGDELVEAPPANGGLVTIDGVGHLSLAPASAVKLATTEIGGNMMSLVLLSGSVNVNLAPSAEGTVRAFESRFVASAGTSFKVAISEGRPVLSSFGGRVATQQQPSPDEVKIQLVDDLGRPVSSGSQLSVRARSTRQIQVRVTDKNDKPLPDLPVIFSLGSPCLGSIGLAGAAAGTVFQKKTDKRGLAAVILSAGATRCAAAITARVEGTNASLEIRTEITERQGFWTTRNTLLVSAALAGAGIGIGYAVANSGNNTQVQPVPPPGVKP
jgi:hypothetical protein